ncbi:Protein of unknown function (DUF3866) [Micromonospora matsumotoense]|uniref:DUF3866 domain-containing protein n=1 Tax=Micromonospora matsumotoense TaxID=121616 RepID=A0A1C4VDB7_9ACTN|nr:Protein of unknown function (DUF3866) [Micromonospora matsumotoense]
MEIDVALPDGATMRALAYPELVGDPGPGDRVLLNAGALLMGLGTGGYALVVALPDRLPADPPQSGDTRDAGHLVKARYTPLQPIMLGVDEEASPHHALLATVDSLDGMPVVTADLHSALPAILAGIHADAPQARVAYLLTDGGALPAWFSRTLDGLRDALVGTVSVGQAFGGDLEAATLHTGLLAARHVLRADVAIVAQGPGNLGTGTRWGFSGVAVGEAVNAVAVLGGRPVGSLRISDADARPRHQGVSHHSLTAYGRVALAPAELVVPDGLAAELAARVDAALAPLAARHTLVRVDTDGLDAALRALPVGLSTMGRGLDADHAYFLAAAAAGRHAAALVG